ncbi:MAG: ABC transporter permease subunit [Planctomycetota bacterium]|nr:ABC transporter permease subunit [Planctomycetota bacterium]
MSVSAHATESELDALWRARPRSRFVRVSFALFGLLLVGSWFVGDFDFADSFSDTRARNLDRFLDEVRPYPLRAPGPDGTLEPLPWDWGVFGTWAQQRLTDGVSDRDTPGGLESALGTLAISVLAIVLAALASLVFCGFAARTLATPRPFAPHAGPAPWPRRLAWQVVRGATRIVLIVQRSMPEYILAFLLLAMLRTPAWPAVLALAIHNCGILGRLAAETIENADPRPAVALRALGASRTTIALTSIAPAILPRLLTYFFYRWETCVREATVLGILGLASLGWLIDEAQVSGFRYDEMVFFIGLGMVIVLAGDLLSAIARRIVRRAS